MIRVAELIFKVLKVLVHLGFDDIFVVGSDPLIVLDMSFFLLGLYFFLPS